MENLNQNIPPEYPSQQSIFQPPHSPRKPILIGFLIFIFLMAGYSVLAKYQSLWPFQSSKNVNAVAKNLIPLTRETGNYFECVESAHPTQTYEIRDGKVYFDFFTLDGVDVNSFEAFGHRNIFAKDKNFVYAYGTALPSIDVGSFKFLGDYFIKDKNGVYFEKQSNISRESPDFDLEAVRNCRDLLNMSSWEIIDSENGIRLVQKIDSNNIYTIEKLDFFDVATFDVVKVDNLKDSLFGKYVKDKNGVYLVQINRYALEKGNVYQIITIVGADPESFEVVSQDVLKDKNTTFTAGYDSQQGIATFKITGPIKLTKWEDERISFSYDPVFFVVTLGADKEIMIKEKGRYIEYTIFLQKIGESDFITLEKMYELSSTDLCSGCDAKMIKLGNYEYIKSTSPAYDEGWTNLSYQTIVPKKYMLGLAETLFGYTSPSGVESVKKLEQIISTIIVKN